jgi:uncharacterized protein
VLITLEALEDEPLRFDEVFAANQVDFAVPGLRQVAPLHVKGVASAIEREIHIRGDLTTQVEMECARCLDPVTRAVKRDFDLFYEPLDQGPEGDELVVPKGEEELGFYSGEGVVLEDVAKEQVLLSLPMRTVCREDCKGLCPTCGINRNRESCKCKDTGGDPRWAALKNL